MCSGIRIQLQNRPGLFSGLVLGLALSFGTIRPSASEWHSERGFQWAELNVSKQGRAGFTLLPAAGTGIRFTNEVDELAGAANRVLYNGSGVAAGDFDNDGLPDIFLCNLNGRNALYKNLGQFKFRDVTAGVGLGSLYPRTRGAVFADINADSWLDLLITVTGRGLIFFLNDGKGHFTEAQPAPGMAGNLGSTSIALADVDGNGTLDLYLVNYRPDDVRDLGRVNISMINGRPILPGSETNRFKILNGQLAECGQPDQLFLNDGRGNFKPVPWTGGAFTDEEERVLQEPPLDWGLTATFRDINDDLAPDLYVCNDYWTPDRFWVNDRKGHFRAIGKLAMRKMSASSMSVDFADVNRDGQLDFFVVDMLSRYPAMRKRQGFAQMPVATPVGIIDDRPQVMRNTLFLKRPDGSYAEIAFFANLPASDWSWTPVFLDVDLDGFEDLLIGAGHFRDVQDYDGEQQIRARQHPWQGFKSEAERQKAYTRELMEHLRLYPLLKMPIGAFRNQGDCIFSEVTDAWGLADPGVHQGLATADFDRDGCLDLVVNNLNTPATILRNNSAAGRVAVRLKGQPPNTQAIGAKISLLNGAIPRQTTEIVCGGRYQSGCDTEAVFATGTAASGMSIAVCWRNGARTVINDVRANRVYLIEEISAEPATSPPASKAPIFEDVSVLIGMKHFETAYDDFERQPLLPFKISQLGPGVAWYDLDGDDHDDLVIGAARGGTPTALRSDGRGHFSRWPVDSVLSLSNDLAGVIGWVDPEGTRKMLASLTGYETKNDRPAIALGLEQGRLTARGAFPVGMATGGALALGDMNGDGRLALFVAGGVSPGRYPNGAPSTIFRFDGREWKADARNSQMLENLGIVNAAIWSDLEGDGIPELVVACEWGPIRVFRKGAGALLEATAEFGLKEHTGWWRGVTTGDLNNDGKLDIIASNWGFNSPYRASDKQPLIFLYGELSQPGITDVIETEYERGVLVPVRQFMAIASSMPFLHAQFQSHKAYSEASLEQVLGERKVLAKRVAATSLASTVFINTGKGFKPVELPREAQFSPAFSVNVGDFDGDGNEDLFLSQNFFATRPEDNRIDAGVGLLLAGDGTGALIPLPSTRAGIQVHGEQRGAALGDYDEDGRVDLVVTQNGAETRLFRNMGAAPGLRVRLKGPPGNPSGINAVMRLRYKEGEGPAREVHGGSGYWSQDSLTQVLGTPTKPEQLVVRWPGGRVTSTPVPAGAKEITVDTDGKTL